MVRALSALLTLLPLGMVSCLRDYGEAPFACASAICPEGYRCVGKVCRREGTSRAPDGFVAPRDGAGVEAATAAADSTPAQLPDLSSPGSSCAVIMDCCKSCSTEACCNVCVNAGSLAAKAKYGAVEACYEAADFGVCDPICSQNPESYSCWDCILAACQGQIKACRS